MSRRASAGDAATAVDATTSLHPPPSSIPSAIGIVDSVSARTPAASDVFFKQLRHSAPFRTLTAATLFLTVVTVIFTLLDYITTSALGPLHGITAVAEIAITAFLGIQLYVAYRAQRASSHASRPLISTPDRGSSSHVAILSAFLLSDGALTFDVLLFALSAVCLCLHHLSRSAKWATLFRELEWVAVAIRCWSGIFRVAMVAARTSSATYNPSNLDFISLNTIPARSRANLNFSTQPSEVNLMGASSIPTTNVNANSFLTGSHHNQPLYVQQQKGNYSPLHNQPQLDSSIAANAAQPPLYKNQSPDFQTHTPYRPYG